VACERREEIDQLIERNAEHWRMDRMAASRSQSAARRGRRVPRISPNTAAGGDQRSVGDRSRFSTPESVQFINGVLDSVARELAEKK